MAKQRKRKSLTRSKKPAKKALHPSRGNGKICYIEIPALDIHASAEFYSAVFGWKIRTRSDGRLAFDDSVNEVSGRWVTGRKSWDEPGLLLYIMVDDASAVVELVKARGGKIVQAIGGDAPEITARFRDPGGNVLGIYQERSS